MTLSSFLRKFTFCISGLIVTSSLSLTDRPQLTFTIVTLFVVLPFKSRQSLLFLFAISTLSPPPTSSVNLRFILHLYVNIYISTTNYISYTFHFKIYWFFETFIS